MRIGVAATAPIGADVLERLAESHEIAFLLTRPDARAGRGRRLAPPPAKLVADQLGIPVHQPEKPELPAEVDRMVVCAYGLYIPPRLLERTLWMNVHPVAAAALARRRAGRARDPRGRRPDGRDDPRDGRGARRRAGRGAEAFDVGDLDAGQVFARSAEVAARLLNAVIESPDVRAPGRGRRDVRREDRPRRPRARSRRSGRRVAPRPRALAAHRRVGDAARPARDRLEGAARGRRVRPRGRPAGRAQPDDLRRVPARRPMIAPARRAAFEVVRRVFEEDAYADRALASAVEGLDERDRALAQRLAYGTVQRTRTIDFGIEQLGKRPVRKLDPPVRAALRVGAYQLASTDQAVHAVVDDAVELVRAAKRERAVPFTNAVMRRLAQAFNGLVASLPEGPVKHSYPDWIFDVWERDFGARRRAVADARAERAAALEVRADEPVGEPTDVPGAYVVERVDTGAACGR